MNSITNEPLKRLLEKLDGVRQTGPNQWEALCPAHDDRRPSLHVSLGEKWVVVNCKANCTPQEVVAAVGMEMSDLFLPNASPIYGDSASNADGRGKIIATYDYYDEDGTLLSQVVRFDPKDFRQCKPRPKGGWEWNIKGVKRVPYRLPELVAADPTQTVFVVEGEKDVDNLRSLGLVATCNAMGAGKWKDELSQYLRDRHVVILPDNDIEGRKHAEQVAASLLGIATSVKIVELPDLSEKGDVSDWLEAGGTKAELLHLVEQARDSEALESNANLLTFPEIEVYRPFPVRSLPKVLSDLVHEGSKAIRCDPVFVAIPALTACAAAIGNSRIIRIKDGWDEPSVLWAVIIGESGTAKTPAFELAIRPIRQLQEREFNGHDKSEKLPMARYMVIDTTVEALAPLLKVNPRGLLLCRDELSGWFASFDRYAKCGRTNGDAAHWLTIYRASPLLVDRKTGDSRTIYVPRAAVCITGCVQPSVLNRAFGVENRENGLAARLLLAYPPRQPKCWSDSCVPREVTASYAKVLERLYDFRPGVADDNDSQPKAIVLSGDAKKLFVEFVNRHGQETAALDGELAAAWSKLEGYAARLALVIHCVRVVSDETDVKEIDETSMRSALDLISWFKDEARRVYQLLAESEADRNRRRLLNWIENRSGQATAREAQQRFSRFKTSVVEAEAALSELVRMGFGEWQPIQPNGKGGRPSRVFVLHTASSSTKPQQTAESSGCVGVEK